VRLNRRSTGTVPKKGHNLTMMEGHVYTLRLENDCYYVGWSSQIDTRIAQHFLGDGAKWTQLNPPIEVIAIVKGDHVMEKATTIAMMCRHGWEKVRGGPWCQFDMSCPQVIVQAKKRKHEETEHPTREIWQTKPDGEYNAWRAKIYGEKANRECPVHKFKMMYGKTLEDVTKKADAWEADCSNA